MTHTQGEPEWVATRDGRRLYAMVHPGPEGFTGPTVVFEAGAAATRSSWAAVQPEIGRHTRAIAYDRSGLGRSAPDPGGRTLRRMADDLNDVLDHFGQGPYLLAGHSAGGPIVRQAAARRPERIAGLVLVDPADEAAEVLFGRAFRIGERVTLGAGGVLARLGLLKVVFRGLLRDIPDDVRRDLEREAFTVGTVRTHREQARTFLGELALWRHDPPVLGDIPLTVVSGGLGGGMRERANAAHAHRVTLSPAGRHVIAERSGHYVPKTEPEVIVREIVRMT